MFSEPDEILNFEVREVSAAEMAPKTSEVETVARIEDSKSSKLNEIKYHAAWDMSLVPEKVIANTEKVGSFAKVFQASP